MRVKADVVRRLPDTDLRDGGRRRWWAMAGLSLAMIVLVMDATVLSVALPTLAGVLGASEADMQWFFTAYIVSGVAAMLPVALVGDRFGRKALLVAGLVLFGAGSAALAYAPDPAWFIALRVALGLAAATVIVMVIAYIPVLFSEAERPRAMALWSAANFLGVPIGPIVGGWILVNGWWGWIFLINVPVALIALVAVLGLVPESRASRTPRIDIPGVVLSAGGLGALMYGIIRAGEEGWAEPTAIAFMGGGLAALALFVTWERRLGGRPGGEPLVDLSLFRSRSYLGGAGAAAFAMFGLYGVLFVLPQYSQAIMGLDAQGSGFRLLAVIGGLLVGAAASARVAARVGARVTVASGFAVLAAGLALGTGLTSTSGDGFVAAWSFLAGLGGGLGFATSASAALVELSSDRAAVGSAVLQAINKTAPALAAAIMGSVLNATYQAQVHVAGLPAAATAATQSSVFGGLSVAQKLGSAAHAASVQAAFVDGLDDALRVAAVGVALGIIAALVFLPGRARSTETRPAEAHATAR